MPRHVNFEPISVITSTQPVVSGASAGKRDASSSGGIAPKIASYSARCRRKICSATNRRPELNSRLLSITPSAWFHSASRRPSQLNSGAKATSSSVGVRRSVHCAPSDIWRCGLRVSTKPDVGDVAARAQIRPDVAAHPQRRGGAVVVAVEQPSRERRVEEQPLAEGARRRIVGDAVARVGGRRPVVVAQRRQRGARVGGDHGDGIVAAAARRRSTLPAGDDARQRGDGERRRRAHVAAAAHQPPYHFVPQGSTVSSHAGAGGRRSMPKSSMWRSLWQRL